MEYKYENHESKDHFNLFNHSMNNVSRLYKMCFCALKTLSSHMVLRGGIKSNWELFVPFPKEIKGNWTRSKKQKLPISCFSPRTLVQGTSKAFETMQLNQRH